jgi:hypothetical protein
MQTIQGLELDPTPQPRFWQAQDLGFEAPDDQYDEEALFERAHF